MESKINLKDNKKIFAEYIKELRGCNELMDRVYCEEMRNPDQRVYQRDFARVMYAPSFRRMQGKMQLLGIKNDEYFRNRLTHSLEVAQIARSIAEELGYTDREFYVVEAGALAHDIGNPPFGHSGERCLNKLFDDIGGFEGNAQTLRILTKIENKNPEFGGLNLTYRTLLSVLKYNKERKELECGKKNEKFIYGDDYDLLNDFIKKHKIRVRTLDVQIVDKSDEIAYAAHDLEDGLRQGCFTIDDILHEFYCKYSDSDAYKTLKSIIEKSKKKAGYLNNNCKENSSLYQQLFRQELTSKIINTLIQDLGMKKVDEEFKDKSGTKNEYELDFISLGELASGLKKITFKCIMNKNDVWVYEKKGDIILGRLKDIYINNPQLMSPNYLVNNFKKRYNNKKIEKDDLQKRLVCDYISGMMDSYAISEYEKLTGISFEKIPFC
ncbi:MAG: dNTP triphosphohydrolase [Lachnospiraceae bacterium]|nr:dNTP triphosphohydrolase [Lachnospiraceae bacterium]